MGCRARHALAAAFAVSSTAFAGAGSATEVRIPSKPTAIAAAPAQAAVISPVASQPTTTQTARTRFVIGLDRKVTYEVFSLSNPNRVVVELPDASLQLPDPTALGQKSLVTSFRGGLAAPGKSRIVIEVSEPVVVETSKLEKDKNGAWRLAIDFLGADAAMKESGNKKFAAIRSNMGASAIQPPLPKRAESPKARAARAFKPVIVLDPGHGGDDSGAMKFGTIEKNVVLAFGHVLRKKLEKTGRYKVAMTRDKDVFIPLDERLEIGEQHGANLFIAIHADYARSSARGATIFTLRDRVANDLKQSTKNRANVLNNTEIDTVKASNGDVGAVRDILSDLAERDVELTHERTSLFARAVVENMGETTPMRNDPEQQAAFRVLKTAQFPSVLIELAYVTNKQDANNLNSDDWREKVADSIATAIDNYFSAQIAHMPM